MPEDAVIKATAFSIEGNPDKVDKNNVSFSGTLECSAGYFGRPLTVVIFPYAAGQVSAETFFTTNDIFISAGESAPFSASGVIASGEPGKRYFAVLYDGQTSLTAQGSELVFTIGDTAGIEEGTADRAVTATRVYAISGLPAAEYYGAPADALAGLPSGIYIIETITPYGRETRRAIKR